MPKKKLYMDWDAGYVQGTIYADDSIEAFWSENIQVHPQKHHYGTRWRWYCTKQEFVVLGVNLDADQIMRVLTWLDNAGYVDDFEQSLNNELPHVR